LSVPTRPLWDYSAVAQWKHERGEWAPMMLVNATTGQQGWKRSTYDDGHGRFRYAVYVPQRLPRHRRVPVMVVLHGCTQSADDAAAGTRMNAMADRCGFVVVYPEQREENNRQRCWNWYLPEHQVRGSGEPAAIAGIVAQVLGSDIAAKPDRSRVYVVGLSAGGSMATIMGATYPDLFAGVGIHSGLSYGAARTVPGALASMKLGGPDPAERGRQAYAAMGEHARMVPAVVIHGVADQTVSVKNGDRVVRQWLTANQHASSSSLVLDADRPDDVHDGYSTGGLRYDARTWNDRFGRPLVQYWLVAGLGHAWSGGSPAGSYTDPAGPDATAVMWNFLREHRLAAEHDGRIVPLTALRHALIRVRRLTSRCARRAISRVVVNHSGPTLGHLVAGRSCGRRGLAPVRPVILPLRDAPENRPGSGAEAIRWRPSTNRGPISVSDLGYSVPRAGVRSRSGRRGDRVKSLGVVFDG
jgi:poly(hydroxyalkanoate) depolymerase family esterase